MDKVTRRSNWLNAKILRLKADTVREDGRLERVCKHGVGHTVGYVADNHPELKQEWFWVHGCCGEHCCREYEREEL